MSVSLATTTDVVVVVVMRVSGFLYHVFSIFSLMSISNPKKSMGIFNIPQEFLAKLSQSLPACYTFWINVKKLLSLSLFLLKFIPIDISQKKSFFILQINRINAPPFIE
jgi:hypothetical protein